MRKIAMFSIALLLCGKAFSQFPFFQNVLPGGVKGVSFGDTMLNTSAILKREGIRKITAAQSSFGKVKSFSSVTTYLHPNGKIASVITCMRHSKNSDNSFCLKDTLFYDDRARVIEFQMQDASGFIYLTMKMEYDSGGKVKHTWITVTPQKVLGDTDILYRYFNDKGQLIRSEHEGKKFAFQNASLYYNADGLPDSIRHDDRSVATYIFTRNEKRNSRELSLETATHQFKWVYNLSGQCISSEWEAKNQMPGRRTTSPAKPVQWKIDYYYNANGTLSKVVEKRDGKKISSVVYSYE